MEWPKRVESSLNDITWRVFVPCLWGLRCSCRWLLRALNNITWRVFVPSLWGLRWSGWGGLRALCFFLLIFYLSSINPKILKLLDCKFGQFLRFKRMRQRTINWCTSPMMIFKITKTKLLKLLAEKFKHSTYGTNQLKLNESIQRF